MNKEEINVNIMSSEELEDFEYLIQNYSKSKLAYKIIKIEEESRLYYNANLELRQENKQLNMQLDQALKDYDEEMQKNMKAIEVFEKCKETDDFSTCFLEMYEILKGE